MSKLRHSIDFFANQYQNFYFDVHEYFEAAEYFKDNSTKIVDHQPSLITNSYTQDTNRWFLNRELISSITNIIPAYKSIQWAHDNFQKDIPLIDKAMIRSNPDHYLNPKLNPFTLYQRPTSGTSGRPLTIYYPIDYFFHAQYRYLLDIASHADLLEQEMLDRPILCIHIINHKYLKEQFWADPSDLSGFCLRVVINESDEKSITRVFDLISFFQPSIISLCPAILSTISLYLQKNPLTLDSYVKLIVSGGSELNPDFRIKLQDLLHIPIINMYGMTEIGIIASECRLQDGLHIFEHNLIAEIRDQSGDIHPTGYGELIASTVTNIAMPLLHYCTGDYVEIVDTPCACGLHTKRIKNLFGRVVNPFIFRDGAHFAPTHFNILFKKYPINEFQATQLRLDLIEIVIDFDHDDHSIIDFDKIALDCSRLTDLKSQIIVKQGNLLGKGKISRYRSLVN